MMKKEENKNDTNSQAKSNPMWGGHYAGGVDAIMEKINASIGFDKALYKQDITGSLAHVSMLGKTGILTDNEVSIISKGLQQIHQEIEDGKMVWKPELEDIHMHVEARLREIVGDVGGKLHTARSRNDQVATDFRMYVMEECYHIRQSLMALQHALMAQAELHADTIMPGFTHLQTAQPVTFGHHCMAYVEMLSRDESRFYDADIRMSECPLGSAALAGTSFPIDRDMTCESLTNFVEGADEHEVGFLRPCGNSLDAVGSRDFAIEFLSAATICGTHLSRLAEELVVWSSALVNFVTLPESFTSGSSIMPQKRNPDAAELVRAKTGRLNGNLLHLLTVLKGTPLAYNKDLQEDKEPVFDTVDNLKLCLAAMTGMIEGLSVNKEAMLEAASGGFSTATDLADWLVRELNMPFRNAHHVTGSIVNLAEEKKCHLWDISLEAMQEIEPRITEDVFNVLTVEHSVASRMSYGGTAPEQVRAAIARARAEYEL